MILGLSSFSGFLCPAITARGLSVSDVLWRGLLARDLHNIGRCNRSGIGKAIQEDVHAFIHKLLRRRKANPTLASGNRERMRRSFVRVFGQSPQAIQRTVSALIQ